MFLLGGITLIVGSVQESNGAYEDAAPLFIAGGAAAVVGVTWSLSGPIRIAYAKGRIADAIQHRDAD